MTRPSPGGFVVGVFAFIAGAFVWQGLRAAAERYGDSRLPQRYVYQSDHSTRLRNICTGFGEGGFVERWNEKDSTLTRCCGEGLETCVISGPNEALHVVQLGPVPNRRATP